jgi:acyl carrier protein
MDEAGTRKDRFLRLLETTAQLSARTLRGSDEVSGLPLDSLALMNLIADVDREFQVTLSPTDLSDSRTVDDLYARVAAGSPGPK